MVGVVRAGKVLYMDTKTDPNATLASELQRRHDASVHSLAMEGLTISAETEEDSLRCVAGEISAAELVERVEARYGLT